MKSEELKRKREAAERNVEAGGTSLLCFQCALQNDCHLGKDRTMGIKLSACADFCAQWLKDNPEEEMGHIKELKELKANVERIAAQIERLDAFLREEPQLDWEAKEHDPEVIPNNWLTWKWDDDDTYNRVLGFFKRSRDIRESRYLYDHYRAIPRDQWPEWAVKAHKSLEE